MTTVVSKRLRFHIFKRDDFTCQYCGRKPPETVLEVDHVVAVSRGGQNDERNLLTACFDCNRGKADGTLQRPPILDIAKKRFLIEERREQIIAYEQALSEEQSILEERVDAVIAIYDYYFENLDRYEFTRSSIRNFLRHLPLTEVQEAMEMACERMRAGNVFRYFCGVCWRKIKGPSIVDDGEV